MNELTRLGHKFQTDKVDGHHTYKDANYTDIYYDYLKDLKDNCFNFLEIGVRDGASLNMWSEFFPNANIIGCDINPYCKSLEHDNIYIEIGSQGDTNFLNSLIDKYSSFAVVIDDGSHINDLTLASFNILQEHTYMYYIIEDLRNSYEDLRQDVKSWPGMNLNIDVNFDNSSTRHKLDSLFYDQIKLLDYRKSCFKSIHFHSQLVVFKK